MHATTVPNVGVESRCGPHTVDRASLHHAMQVLQVKVVAI